MSVGLDGIIGIGLMGGSFALDFRSKNKNSKIYGFDNDQKSLDHSIKNKIDSTKLVLELANNKTFSTLNKEQTKKVMPQFNETLKHINENIYGK